MRSSSAVYVDAGYLLASAARRVTGTSLRNGIHVEFRSLIDGLIRHAEEASGLPVLRVHWYDSAKDGVPDAQQTRIGELPKVKLRLGRFGVDGQQKGVDLRIGLDLVAHARNGASDVFFLVTGDDDLTEAVEESQVHGVQVIVVAVPNVQGRAHGVSRHLVLAADEVMTLAPELIDAAVRRVELPAPVPTPAAPVAMPRPTPRDIAMHSSPSITVPTSELAYSSATGERSRLVPGYGMTSEEDEQIDTVVSNVLETFRQSAGDEAQQNLNRGRPSIPREIDRALLTDLSSALDVNDLSDHVRFRLRERFWRAYDAEG